MNKVFEAIMVLTMVIVMLYFFSEPISLLISGLSGDYKLLGGVAAIAVLIYVLIIEPTK